MSKKYKRCQDCDDDGQYYIGDPHGEWEVVQCQWCYETPDSYFNQQSKLQQLEEIVRIQDACVSYYENVCKNDEHYVGQRARACQVKIKDIMEGL